MNNSDRQPLESDDDLIKRSKHDDYQINRITKYAILILSLVVATVLTVIALIAVITDPKWQEVAITAVFNSLPGIVAVVLVVLGLRKNN